MSFSAYPDDEKPENIALPKLIDTEKALAYFGFSIGLLGPITIALKFLWSIKPQFANEYSNFATVILVFGIAVTAVTASVGYFTGKTVGRAVRKIEEYPMPLMLLFSVFIGLGWGIFTGIAGGILIFLIGAVWGGIVGGIAGALALPPFVLLHRYLKTGDLIESSKFNPIAAGIILSLCAFLLGI